MLASTNLFPSRSLNTEFTLKRRPRKRPGPNGETTWNPPSFYSVIRIRTDWRQNESGDWFVFDWEYIDWIDEKNPIHREAFMMAKAFHDSALAGEVKVAPPADEGSAPAGERITVDGVVHDEIPF
jgi:hypothetical protein